MADAAVGNAPIPASLHIDIFGIQLDIFWIGVIGSLAVDLVAVAAIYEAGAVFPSKYKKVGFYLTRAAIALAGGVLVLVYNVNNLPAALQIGASTPAVLAALATVRRPGNSSER